MKMKARYILPVTLLITSVLFAQQPANPVTPEREVVELKIPQSGKAIIRIVFRNGSITDPAGKEGLTQLTADMIVESGTAQMNSTAIRQMIYPWSASLSSFTDK